MKGQLRARLPARYMYSPMRGEDLVLDRNGIILARATSQYIAEAIVEALNERKKG